jgi:hypothetical protein
MMYLFQHGQDFTPTDLANYTVKASDIMYEEGGFFWTKHQWDLIQRDERRVLFVSEFGTGKTLLMKSKAKVLADEIDQLIKEETIKKQTDGCLKQGNEGKASKCFFIVFTKEKSILIQGLKKEFEAYWTSKNHRENHIEVLSFFEKGW